MVPPALSQPRRVWAAVGSRLDLPLADAEVQRALDETDRRLGPKIYQYVGRTGEYWHLYDNALMDLLDIRDRREEIEAAVQRVFDDPSVVLLYPEARSVLDHLRSQGYSLGLISNHHDGLLTVLKYHGLDRCFESVTYSQEVGAEKPSPTIFQRALERAGCSPTEAMHVGDSLLADVEGALRCGLGAVWVNRDGRPGSTTAFTIRNLNELAPLVEGLHRPSSG